MDSPSVYLLRRYGHYVRLSTGGPAKVSQRQAGAASSVSLVFSRGPGRRWLAALELSAVSRQVTGDALALIDALQQPTGRLD